MVKTICVVGRQNSGKTTFIENFLIYLNKMKFSVGVLKHTHHEIDKSNKDSYRLSKHANQLGIISNNEFLFHAAEPFSSIDKYISLFYQLDYLIIEGGKHLNYPKIEIVNLSLEQKPLFQENISIDAVICSENRALELPQFKNNEFDQIIKFINQKTKIQISEAKALILVGGQSIRMGSNKALLPFGQKTIIETIVDQLKNIFKDIVLIGKKTAEYDLLNMPFWEDIYPEQCAMSGILTGLSMMKDNFGFFISCDQLFFSNNSIGSMYEKIKEYDGVILKNRNQIEPLFGFYQKNMILKMSEAYFKKEFSLKKILNELNICYLEEPNLKHMNINDPVNYQKALSIMSNQK